MAIIRRLLHGSIAENLSVFHTIGNRWVNALCLLKNSIPFQIMVWATTDYVHEVADLLLVSYYSKNI
ncbi:hypothetical protein [Pontibacter silvestris]|uniref:hypothetical protein n=1 Tax=Pontibacter silvestris TaxID=2305183 RepID=UPI001E59E57E|nr:hypothetical protein [Pontibacter silvestris]MCC9138661.1 hypothetical protein [Pontibacter silvestris]